MTASKIEWCDRSDWNPIRGCTRESEGCRNCYAETLAARFSDPGQPFHGFAERTKSGPRWTGKVELIEERLDLPLRWRKPVRIFVNSMFDLFHESVADGWIERVFGVMEKARQHTFLVLTKRAERMRAYMRRYTPMEPDGVFPGRPGPLPNVWFGVSVEDQPRFDERVTELRATPAAARFVSLEPLLGPIDTGSALFHPAVMPYNTPGIDWVIVGGESGPGARPFHLSWAASIVEQCRATGVACFVKQFGARAYDDRSYVAHTPYKTKDKKGGDWSEWPNDLQVREFPR